MMKKRVVYNEQVKTLMLTVEAIRGYGGLPEDVAEKRMNFVCILIITFTVISLHHIILIIKYVWKKSLILSIKKQAESKTVPLFDYLFVFLI